MARMTTRIASGLAAAGIATILSTSPAEAVKLPGPDRDCVANACADFVPGTTTGTATKTTTSEATPWLKIVLGAAGGVAVVGAAAATVSSRNRRQPHQPHAA